jgi:protein required for attachment to host cells
VGSIVNFEDGKTMRKIGIIAADAARARFITAQILEDVAFEGSPKLLEHAAVVNPLGKLSEQEKFSDRESRKPSGAGPRGALPVTDDHRAAHQLEEERRFARLILEAADGFIQAERPSQLLLLAGPQLLGVLRRELGSQRWGKLEVQELAHDLSGRSLPELREILTRRGLLPKAELPRGGVYRPRGQEPSTR